MKDILIFDWTSFIIGLEIAFPLGVVIGVKLAERWYRPFINEMKEAIAYWHSLTTK